MECSGCLIPIYSNMRIYASTNLKKVFVELRASKLVLERFFYLHEIGLEIKLERVMRFELTTYTLATCRSTPELHPHPIFKKAL